MQIHDRFNDPRLTGSRRPEDAQASDRSADAPAASSSTRTSLTGAVLQELRELPEVRTDLIARVRQRLTDGEYLTSDAATATARVLLNAG